MMKCKVCGKMHGFSEKQCRFNKVKEAAEDKFWAEVAHWYPAAKTGDMDPDLAVKLSKLMGEAVERWVKLNVEE